MKPKPKDRPADRLDDEPRFELTAEALAYLRANPCPCRSRRNG